MSPDSLASLGAPHWSPYAIAAGAVIGFLFGALSMALFALRLQRLERFAGSGRIAALRTACRRLDETAYMLPIAPELLDAPTVNAFNGAKHRIMALVHALAGPGR